MSKDIFKNFIQVAGVLNFQEAKDLVDVGVIHIGFPLRLDVHEADVSEEEARSIIERLPSKTRPILITYLNDANEIITLCKKLGVRIVQLHGPINVKEIDMVKHYMKHIKIIKSLIIKNDNFSELEKEILKYSNHVDAFITDSYDPATGATGATGKTHDWNISKKIVKVSPLPVILAGGLNSRNVRKAILKVRPAGVDSHTGVEDENGQKDLELVKEFLSEANEAFTML